MASLKRLLYEQEPMPEGGGSSSENLKKNQPKKELTTWGKFLKGATSPVSGFTKGAKTAWEKYGTAGKVGLVAPVTALGAGYAAYRLLKRKKKEEEEEQ